MEKDGETDDLNEASIEAFRLQFDNYVREHCNAAQNSSTMTVKKRDRIIRYLKDSKSEPSARFRFWVRSKGFRIVQTPDAECILAIPPRGNDPNDTLFRRVPVIDDFFDIIYAAHCENGHVGQAQTFSAAQNPFAVVKRDHDSAQTDGFDETEESVSNQQDMASALSEFLTGKISGTDNDMEAEAVEETDHVDPSEEPGSDPGPLIFSCHLCKQVFNRRKALQKHIISHQDYRPTVPLTKTPPHSKKRRFNLLYGSQFLTATSQRPSIVRKKIILDVDSSPTIAQAIFLAASRPDLDLMAVNCVAGRVSVLHACENTLRVLKTCGREDVHVCRGAEKSLLGLYGKAENLPGIAWTRKVDGHVQAEHSVSSLIRCVNENPGEITLVCLGPLTNLALALRLDPLIASNLKELIIVGGNIEGQGDLSVCAEENFLFDPEAAHIVLQEFQDVILLPLEVSHRHIIPFKNYISWLNTGTELANFLVESVTQDDLQQQAKTGIITPEVFAIAMVIDPSVELEKEKLYAVVELRGEHSRGLMVTDRKGRLGRPANVYVLKNLDLSKTQALLGGMFATASGAQLVEGTTMTVSDPNSPPNNVVDIAVTGAAGSSQSVPILFKESRVAIL